MERVYLEIATQKNCPEGVLPGEVIVTDLDNYGFPMIRYRIEDMARLASPNMKCGCGRELHMLEEMQGRSMDVVKTLTGRTLPGTFWTILMRPIPGIDQIQIVQKSLNHIVFNLKIDRTFPIDAVPRLQETVRVYCGQETQVDINLLNQIEPGPSGKFRFVISELEH